MRILLVLLFSLFITACATLTNDPNTPIALSFSDGSVGSCELTNKRGAWTTDVPTTIPVRRSDDALRYECNTADGRRAIGTIASEMGAKIVASAVFLDLGITDAITDKHRHYAASFVIPIKPINSESSSTKDSNDNTELETLNDLKERGVLSEEEFESEKKRILEQDM